MNSDQTTKNQSRLSLPLAAIVSLALIVVATACSSPFEDGKSSPDPGVLFFTNMIMNHNPEHYGPYDITNYCPPASDIPLHSSGTYSVDIALSGSHAFNVDLPPYRYYTIQINEKSGQDVRLMVRLCQYRDESREALPDSGMSGQTELPQVYHIGDVESPGLLPSFYFLICKEGCHENVEFIVPTP